MNTINVNKELLDFAIERSGKNIDNLKAKFSWFENDKLPTFKQLEKFAHDTFTPIGLFFLNEPPTENLPINDFRTIADEQIKRPSANLLDTIYACQSRQNWYINYVKQQDLDKVSITGKYQTSDEPSHVAHELSKQFSLEQSYNNQQEALSERIDLLEKQGILVMSSGVALGNTHRALNVDEFRGFSLSDEYAPVIFINAKDSTSARSFTLMHELAHLSIGNSGISNIGAYDNTNNKVERWCNRVAAEILVPESAFKKIYQHNIDDLHQNLDQLSKKFNVSRAVILGRIWTFGFIQEKQFWHYFNQEKEAINRWLAEQETMPKKSGGNFYYSKPVAVSKRFSRAITADMLAGNTLYRDAMQLLHIKKTTTLNNFISKLHSWA